MAWMFLLATGVPARAQEDHRAAVERLIAALHTMAMIEHLALPMQIRAAAIDDWGFESAALGPDEVLAIERLVDVARLRDEIVQAHMAVLSADQALEAARFFESEPARRVLATLLADSLPLADPLRRANLPPASDADERAFEQFSQTPLGAHLKSVSAPINERSRRALEAVTDAAIQKYVAERRLPNTRTPARPRA